MQVVAFDLETTGLNPNVDRIVEIAGVIFDVELGQIVGEFETLVNPLRNIPLESTRKHGLVADHVSAAPLFEEFAPWLSSLLSGRAFLAHNAGFDFRFVKSEFERASISFESPGFICSQRLCGNLSLASACEALDIPLENHHSALADARACLEIFRKSRVGELPEMTFDKIVNSVGFVPPATLTRTQVGLRLDRKPVNPFSRRVHFPSLDSHYTYLAMLNEFLEDMSLSQSELENLSLLAGELGISADQESKLKLSYLDAIEKACLRDGIISDRESTLLNSFAKLLDIKKVFEAKNQTVDLPVPGSLICVTGTAMIHGINWDKSAWRTKLAELGYLFTDELRKGDDVALLLQESAGSQSSKVRRAMTWGVPRMTFEAFLELLD